MRTVFFKELYGCMLKNKNVYLIIADNGAIVSDDLRSDLKDRCVNIGTAEQNMIGVAAGMALSGKTVYVFTMVPFATMRCYEQIRIDLALSALNVKIVGVGPGVDYSTLGPTHHGYEDIALMRNLPNMTVLSPSDNAMAGAVFHIAQQTQGPVYIRLDREEKPSFYKNIKIDTAKGFIEICAGKELCIITTGRMLFTALELKKKLKKDFGIIDLFKLKPVNTNLLLNALRRYKKLITMEEHFVTGGLGSLMSDIITENDLKMRLRKIGINDCFYTENSTRDYARRKLGLTADVIIKKLKLERYF